jgi:hypothetical protein
MTVGASTMAGTGLEFITLWVDSPLNRWRTHLCARYAVRRPQSTHFYKTPFMSPGIPAFSFPPRHRQ